MEGEQEKANVTEVEYQTRDRWENTTSVAKMWRMESIIKIRNKGEKQGRAHNFVCVWGGLFIVIYNSHIHNSS